MKAQTANADFDPNYSYSRVLPNVTVHMDMLQTWNTSLFAFLFLTAFRSLCVTSSFVWEPCQKLLGKHTQCHQGCKISPVFHTGKLYCPRVTQNLSLAHFCKGWAWFASVAVQTSLQDSSCLRLETETAGGGQQVGFEIWRLWKPGFYHYRITFIYKIGYSFRKMITDVMNKANFIQEVFWSSQEVVKARVTSARRCEKEWPDIYRTLFHC